MVKCHKNFTTYSSTGLLQDPMVRSKKKKFKTLMNAVVQVVLSEFFLHKNGLGALGVNP